MKLKFIVFFVNKFNRQLGNFFLNSNRNIENNVLLSVLKSVMTTTTKKCENLKKIKLLFLILLLCFV